MSRSEKFFRRNATPTAQWDAERDPDMRRIWNVLCEQFGVDVANSHYVILSWIVDPNPSEEQILEAYRLWSLVEYPAGFTPYEKPATTT